MKKLILFTVILLRVSVNAQELSTDSLQQLLLAAKQDTTRVILLSQLSKAFQHSNPDTAFLLGQQGLQLAKRIKYLKGEQYCKVSLGFYWWGIGDYSTAIQLVLPVLPITKTSEFAKDSGLQILSEAVLINSYRDQGDYSEALKHALSTPQTILKYQNCLYCKIKIAIIADIYLKKNQPDSAHIYLLQALNYPPSPGFDGWIYLVAGQVYNKLRNYDIALKFYRRSIQKLIEDKDLKDLAGAYNSVSDLFITIGLIDLSLFYANKSLTVSKPNKFAKEILESNILLSRIYETFNTDKALYYYKEAMAQKDSLYSQDKQRQILGYQFNERLRLQEVQEANTKYQNRIQKYLLIGGLIAVLLIAGILYRSNRQKQKAKDKIEKAYTELKSTQAQLIQSEKMASLGELTAGIAHEIQNPLNFVNNFSEVNKELIEEMKEEIR